jgi:hypothetical protein
MRQDTQDTTARTASSRFSTADFDCELPPGARAELLKPKRPRILGHPSHAPDRRSAIVLAVLVLLLLAGVVVALIQHQAPTITPAVQPPARPQPTASAVPIQTPAAPEHVVEQPILPPRAQLVKLPPPAPKAQLVHLRAIGSFEYVRMPDWRLLGTVYRGELPSAADLPRTGAQLGDMWYTRADGHSWVLAPISAGSSQICWVDP